MVAGAPETAGRNGYRITNVSTQLAADATTAVPSPGTSIVHATPTDESNQVWVIR